MVLGGLLDMAARVGAHARKALQGTNHDKHLSFTARRHVPELTTLRAAPDQINSDEVAVDYDHTRKCLTVGLEDEEYTFIFRDDDVMVLSTTEFNPGAFREQLKRAVVASRTRQEDGGKPAAHSA